MREGKADFKTFLAWGGGVGGAVAIVFLAMLFWNRRLNREIGERRRTEAEDREIGRRRDAQKRQQRRYDFGDPMWFAKTCW